MSITARIERLGIELGLGALSLAEGAALDLSLADGETLSLELGQDGGSLHLHADLGRLPGEPLPRRLCLEAMLAACHVDSGTDGSATALDPRSGTLVLWRSLTAAEIAPETALPAALQAFLARIKAIRTELAALGDDAVPPVARAPGLAEDRNDPLWLYGQFIRG